jgi:hypothetical protein
MSTTLQKADENSKNLRNALWEALEEVRKEAFFLRKNVDLVHSAQVRGLIQKARATRKTLQQYQIDSGLTFHGFPKLPEKIRHKIWREALRQPQIIAVDLQPYTDRTTGLRIEIDQKNAVITPLAPHSPLLRVNREARSIAQTVLVPYHKRVAGVPAVFANTDIDVIWLIDPLNDPDNYNAPPQDYAFEKGLRSLLKPQKCQAGVRRVRKLAFSWKLLTPTIDELEYSPVKVYQALSIFKEMAQAGVKEIYIVVEDNEAAYKQDIVFLPAQKSPQEYLKSGKDWATDSLELLRIEAGDGWNVVAEKVRKSFEELDHKELGRSICMVFVGIKNAGLHLVGVDKIFIPSFQFVDAISASIGRVPKRAREC